MVKSCYGDGGWRVLICLSAVSGKGVTGSIITAAFYLYEFRPDLMKNIRLIRLETFQSGNALLRNKRTSRFQPNSLLVGPYRSVARYLFWRD